MGSLHKSFCCTKLLLTAYVFFFSGFSEATVEVLPRLFKIKYESGTLEELLYEYHNSSGQIVLDYAKAIQESVFEQLRVVRDGQLRIVFSPDLKVVFRNQDILIMLKNACYYHCWHSLCEKKFNLHSLVYYFFCRYALGNFVLGAMKSSSPEDC
jgi:hypothetical protein